jgi:hypothetical protein
MIIKKEISKDIKKEKSGIFHPPAIEAVKSYCQERG